MMKPLLFGAVCTCISIFSSGTHAELGIAQSYDIVRLGLTDTAHMPSGGYMESIPFDINDAGQVAGNAQRYNGTSTYMGQSAWLYDGSSMINIGLVDAEHTRDDGYRYSHGGYLNEAGQVTGTAERFNDAGGWWGKTAWLYDGTNTINVGLIDDEHTRDDGYRESYGGVFDYDETILGNEAGHVAGVATRFNGNDYMGHSAWLYNGTNTINIGLLDAEHTSAYGVRHSDPLHLNEASMVVGLASTFNGAQYQLGRSVWLYNGENTVQIGLVDAEHTAADGRRWYEHAIFLNEAGQVAGIARRYNGNTAIGESAWFYNGSNTINIGLVDAEHTRDDGYRYSYPTALNESGHTVGTSTRYNGTDTRMGSTAWLFDGTSHRYIGLQDAEHISNDGLRSSTAKDINEAGQVIGHSARFNEAGDSMGTTAWLYDGAETFSIGLVDERHTREDGYRSNGASFLNEAGQVAGLAQRYTDSGYSVGYTAWLYDIDFDQTFAIELSATEYGYAFNHIYYLDDDGLVLGEYKLIGADDATHPERAFAFTIEDGAYDLGALVDGGLDEAGWDSLARAYKANDLGQIIGTGYLSDMPLYDSDEWYPNMGYLLTPKHVPITVNIDINPSKKSGNVINLKKGKNLKVAIIGSADFDALQVDPSTVNFGSSESDPIRYKGRDYNKDGFADLILTFRIEETGIACGDTEATLTGQTFPDPVINFAGSDTITVEPCP